MTPELLHDGRGRRLYLTAEERDASLDRRGVGWRSARRARGGRAVTQPARLPKVLGWSALRQLRRRAVEPFTGDDAHIAALTSAYAALVAVLHEAGAVDQRAVAEALKRLAASYEPSQPAVGADLARLAAAVERSGQSGPPA